MALCGIAVIGISIGISYGLSALFQLKMTAVHNILPFLLLGNLPSFCFSLLQLLHYYLLFLSISISQSCGGGFKFLLTNHVEEGLNFY